MDRPRAPSLHGFSADAAWLVPAPRWTNPNPTSLTIEAPARTDAFIDPTGAAAKADAPAWLTPIAGPATLRALVRPEFRNTFDAGALMLYRAPTAWAKL